MIDVLCKGNYKLYIRGYSPLCSYLKTKESYDRWVTRRVWGFRHQISKAKYLKISVENISRCRSKISQDVGRKYLKMSVENIWKLQENTATLCNILPSAWSDPGKRYPGIRICLTGEVETSSSPIRCQVPDVKYPEKVESRPDRIPDVRCPEKVESRPDRIPPRVE